MSLASTNSHIISLKIWTCRVKNFLILQKTPDMAADKKTQNKGKNFAKGKVIKEMEFGELSLPLYSTKDSFAYRPKGLDLETQPPHLRALVDKVFGMCRGNKDAFATCNAIYSYFNQELHRAFGSTSEPNRLVPQTFKQLERDIQNLRLSNKTLSDTNLSLQEENLELRRELANSMETDQWKFTKLPAALFPVKYLVLSKILKERKEEMIAQQKVLQTFTTLPTPTGLHMRGLHLPGLFIDEHHKDCGCERSRLLAFCGINLDDYSSPRDYFNVGRLFYNGFILRMVCSTERGISALKGIDYEFSIFMGAILEEISTEGSTGFINIQCYPVFPYWRDLYNRPRFILYVTYIPYKRPYFIEHNFPSFGEDEDDTLYDDLMFMRSLQIYHREDVLYRLDMNNIGLVMEKGDIQVFAHRKSIFDSAQRRNQVSAERVEDILQHRHRKSYYRMNCHTDSDSNEEYFLYDLWNQKNFWVIPPASAPRRVSTSMMTLRRQERVIFEQNLEHGEPSSPSQNNEDFDDTAHEDPREDDPTVSP